MAKQSSPRASSIASRVMQPSYPTSRDDVIKDAKILAASVLAQDETKGQKTPKPKSGLMRARAAARKKKR